MHSARALNCAGADGSDAGNHIKLIRMHWRCQSQCRVPSIKVEHRSKRRVAYSGMLGYAARAHINQLWCLPLWCMPVLLTV